MWRVGGIEQVAAPLVAVIVLNWNGGRDTTECLESLRRVRYQPLRVVVVDNGSTDDSLEVIRAYAKGSLKVESPYLSYREHDEPFLLVEFSVGTDGAVLVGGQNELPGPESPSVALLKNPQNSGFAEGNNVGIRFIMELERPDYILLLNNDAVLDSDAIDELVKIGESAESIGVVGAKILRYGVSAAKGAVQFMGGFVDLDKFPGYFFASESEIKALGGGDSYRCGWVSGTAMLLKMRSIPIRTLDSSFFFGCEDVDLCVRLAERGFETVLASRATVWHKGGVSRARRFSGRRFRIWLDETKTDLEFLERHGDSSRVPLWICQAVAGRLAVAGRNLMHPNQ